MNINDDKSRGKMMGELDFGIISVKKSADYNAESNTSATSEEQNLNFVNKKAHSEFIQTLFDIIGKN